MVARFTVNWEWGEQQSLLDQKKNRLGQKKNMQMFLLHEIITHEHQHEYPKPGQCIDLCFYFLQDIFNSGQYFFAVSESVLVQAGIGQFNTAKPSMIQFKPMKTIKK